MNSEPMNSEPRTPNPEPRTQNPEPRTQNPEPRTQNPELVIYRPNMRHEMSWLTTWATMARNVWSARELIQQLLIRDLTAQYKKSFIGWLWILSGPIMAIVPWLFAAQAKLYNPGEVEVPLMVYLLVGRSMWSLYGGFYAAASSTLGAGGALMMQVNYPHESLLVKNCISGLINYMFTLLVCIIVMVLHRVYPPWQALLFPLAMLPLFFLGAAMGLMVAMIRVVAYDLDRIIGILMSFLMWTTPIIYSDKVPSPILQTIIKYNPLTYLVCSCRDILIHGRLYNDQVGVYFLCAGVSLLLFLISLRLFFVSEHKLVERMI